MGISAGNIFILKCNLYWQWLWLKELLPTPEVCSSNPVIGKIYIVHLFTVNYIEKTKIKEKMSGMAQ